MQRKEDYTSTKNKGRKSGTDAVSGDPFAYLKLNKNHSYLGHFGKEKFLEQGHNDTPDPKKPIVEEGGFQTPDTAKTAGLEPAGFSGSYGSSSDTEQQRRNAAYKDSADQAAAGHLGESPTDRYNRERQDFVNKNAPKPAPTGGTMAPKLSARDRYRNEHPVKAAVQATRGSVRAAKLGARSAALQAGGTRAEARSAGQAAKVAAKQTRRDVVGAARQDLNARGMERFAKGQAARTRRSARTSTL